MTVPARETGEKVATNGRNLSETSRAYTNTEADKVGANGRREQFEPPTDVELMSQIAKGEREALEALYRRYADAVYSLAVQMLRDGGAAEEVTQDSFFNVWRRASSYSPQRGHVTSWLFSIAHHRAIDELRRRRRHEQAQVPGEVDLANHPSDGSGDPVKYATHQFQRGRVKDALLTLGPEQREVVILAYFGGLTHSEIAKKLGHPLGTVKTRMRLALKKLRQVMAPQSEEWAKGGL